jgi:hypothetical protein
VLAREQELEPNTLYHYAWLLRLIYPHVGRVRASRLSARMVENAYRDLEAAGHSRTTLRTLDLVLCKGSFHDPLRRAARRTEGLHRKLGLTPGAPERELAPPGVVRRQVRAN